MGWRSDLDQAFAPYSGKGCRPARVAAEYQGLFRLYTERGEMLAKIAGKLRFSAGGRADLPAVGDWVAADDGAVIHAVLPRFSRFSRKVAGLVTEEQVVAANADTIFLVSGLDGDFNPRRLERYIMAAWESGANPVIVLNKADLCRDLAEKLVEAEAVAMGVPVHAVSCASGEGLEALAPYLGPGRTAALLGSSGVGKSSLVNRLVGRDVRLVNEVRADDNRGRHTTTSRELIRLPQGGLLLDTPGMRELQFWEAGEGLGEAFADLAALAAACRFRDCRHEDEPGCAVREAIAGGLLPPERLQSYHKLQKELAHIAAKQDQAARLARKTQQKRLSKRIRKMQEPPG